MFNYSKIYCLNSNGSKNTCLKTSGLAVASCGGALVLLLLVLLASPVTAQDTNRNALRDPTRPLTYRATSAEPDRLQLNSILIADDRKIAVINGRQFAERQGSGDLRVVSIEPDRVVVDHKGKRETLVLHRSIRSK